MQRFDMNLLLALDALLEEQSVSRAADRLGLTPPAVSHALGRLRVALDDPLLVRAGQRLVPTPRALGLRDEVRMAVDRARAIFHGERDLDLAAERRTVTIRADDSLVCAHGARLSAIVHRDAPNIRLRFAGRLSEDAGPLRDGSVDLDLGVASDMGPEIHIEALREEPIMGAVRKGHPLASGSISIDAYATAAHVVASRRGRAIGPIDDELGKAGLSRTVSVVVPDTLTALAVAAGSDRVAGVPAGIAAWGREALGLVLFELPVRVPPIRITLFWHPRLERDPVHRWLRSCVRQALEA